MRLVEISETKVVLRHTQTAIRLAGLLFVLLGLLGFAAGVYLLAGVAQLWLFPIVCLLAATFGLAIYIYAPQRTCVLDKVADRFLFVHSSLGHSERFTCRLDEVVGVAVYEWEGHARTSALVRTRGQAGYAVVVVFRDGGELRLNEVSADREKQEQLAAVLQSFLERTPAQ